MIITCPSCQTRYRVQTDALSAAGRQVQCATCATTWVATPSFPQPVERSEDPDPDADELDFRADADTLFSDADEALLDAAFVAQSVEETAPEPLSRPPAPRPRASEGALGRKRTDALARRRNAVIRKLPMARFRRAARVMLALFVFLSLFGAVWFRTEIVRQYPELNALYSVVGLGANVVGLDIGDLNTLRTTRDGNPVIVVNAKISNSTNRLAYVPNVLVSLLGADRQVIYEWSVTPSVRSILPGDVLSIDTQLTSPPQGVDMVRLTFVEGAGGSARTEQ